MPGEFSSGSHTADLLQAPFGKLSAAVQVNGWVLAFTAGLDFPDHDSLWSCSGDRRIADRSANAHFRARRAAPPPVASSGACAAFCSTAEIGLAVLLLSGAGLLIRSFVNVLQTTPALTRASVSPRNTTQPSRGSRKRRIALCNNCCRDSGTPRRAGCGHRQCASARTCYRDRSLAFGDGPPLSYLVHLRAGTISVSPRILPRPRARACFKAPIQRQCR